MAQFRRDQRGDALGKIWPIETWTVSQNTSFDRDQTSESWATENIAINSSKHKPFEFAILFFEKWVGEWIHWEPIQVTCFVNKELIEKSGLFVESVDACFSNLGLKAQSSAW